MLEIHCAKKAKCHKTLAYLHKAPRAVGQRKKTEPEMGMEGTVIADP